ncbi:MAG: hypothetical protein P1V51_00430 [Deltaproteobacteria bacterium]|nr:hypothetical protein [Deltaproteobacteria bacterium]
MTRSTLWTPLVLALLLALTGPGLAEAQRGKTERQTRAEAKTLFQDGQKHYTLGEFDQALEKFTAAYDKLPLAAFLFNIAQCHKEMRNYERAVFFFEGYIREAPDAPNKDVVLELIGESRTALERKQEEERLARLEAERLEAEKAAHEAELAAARAENEKIRKEASERRAKEMAELRRIAEEMKTLKESAAFNPPPPVEEPKTPVTRKWWFWTALGAVALAAAGGGTALALRPTELPGGSLGTIDHRE